MTTAAALSPFAEVLESNTVGWTAQCRDLHCAPELGSFVRAHDDIDTGDGRAVIYGVVSHIATEPFDTGRRPLALWTPEDEMAAKHPQIGKLLRTIFRARAVGWKPGGDSRAISQSLPPQPPRLHSFTQPCTPEEVRRFASRTDFVRLLLDGANGEPGSDELLIAVCRQAVRAHEGETAYKIRLGQALSILLRADYHRLRAILSRIDVSSES